MNSGYLTLFIIILSNVVIMAIVVILYRNMKRSKYDQEKNQVIFDSIRESLEKQRYLISDKLSYNEERWRDINHLLLRKEYLDENSQIDYNNQSSLKLNNFLKSNGISEKDLIIEKRLVFLLTPFHPKFEMDFNVIKDVCQNVGFNCIRGDENYLQGDIFSEMLRYIIKANLIIANINGRNPNVLYELGIAQALDKPVILISREPENLPIDIKSRKFLIYRGYTELKLKLRDELIRVLSR